VKEKEEEEEIDFDRFFRCNEYMRLMMCKMECKMGLRLIENHRIIRKRSIIFKCSAATRKEKD